MDQSRSKSRSRLKKRRRPEKNSSQLSCNTSNTKLDTRHDDLNHSRQDNHPYHVLRSETRQDISRHVLSHVPSGQNTPIPGIGRLGTPAINEKRTTSGKRRTKHAPFLPDIGVHRARSRNKGSDEIMKEWVYDGLLPKPQYIRETRSGIAYQFLYGPPQRRPRRLPRIVSDGIIGQRTSRLHGNEDFLDESHQHDNQIINRVPGIFRSGGQFTDSLRSAAETNRQMREIKNREITRDKLHAQEEKSSCMRNQREENAARVREMRSKQDTIREQERIKLMENFMKRKRNTDN